jgi:predicted anti-sigma-YlaC factor YlaD
VRDDQLVMRCEDCRDAISAQLDGEDLPGEAAAVEAHVAECRDCRGYAERAARVTRLARTGVAEPGPDLVTAVLSAPSPAARRTRVATGVRVALGVLGLGQAALAIAGVAAAGGHDHAGTVELAGASPAHFAHESSAWNLALAVAFLLAATSVSRVAGLVPVIGSFIGVLALLSVIDLLGGRVEVERLLGHGIAVAGFVLLVGLRLLTGGGGGDSGRRAAAGAGRRVASGVDEPLPRVQGEDGDGLAPTARRRAA